MSARRIKPAIIFCLYIIGVMYLCFAKPDDMPQLPQLLFGLPADKVGHFLMFLPFPLLGYMVFANKDMVPARKVILLSILVICGLGMAIGTEQVQAALEYRSADMKDFATDALGLAVGGLATLILIVKRK